MSGSPGIPRLIVNSAMSNACVASGPPSVNGAKNVAAGTFGWKAAGTLMPMLARSVRIIDSTLTRSGSSLVVPRLITRQVPSLAAR